MMLDSTPYSDHLQIQRAVLDFAYRDRYEWAGLRSIFAPTATIRTMWYDGPIEGFIAACAAMAARGTPPPKHWMAPPRIDIREAHAVAETDVMILLRVRHSNADIDVTSWVRFYDLFERDANRWVIQHRTVIYERDRLDALGEWRDRPSNEALDEYPPAYKHLAFHLTSVGASILPGTIVTGSTGEQAVFAAGKQWLAVTP